MIAHHSNRTKLRRRPAALDARLPRSTCLGKRIYPRAVRGERRPQRSALRKLAALVLFQPLARFMLDPGDGLGPAIEPVNLRPTPMGQDDTHIPALAVLHPDRLESHFGLAIGMVKFWRATLQNARTKFGRSFKPPRRLSSGSCVCRSDPQLKPNSEWAPPTPRLPRKPPEASKWRVGDSLAPHQRFRSVSHI